MLIRSKRLNECLWPVEGLLLTVEELLLINYNDKKFVGLKLKCTSLNVLEQLLIRLRNVHKNRIMNFYESSVPFRRGSKRLGNLPFYNIT